ncbi:rhodanese-like domain-containing protein [Sulfuriflexus mobilis]|uniref:rhodanese-like domain-containing protein n=1 Tax=Sulfuriflexus mobilis TaxID=1811807 RepID=UPI000F829509|nr:rhodanese-like domain-containing protein [Sulfuriflexus mobilis]
MKTFNTLVSEYSQQITEIMPWDLEEKLASDKPPLLLDIREPYEFDSMRIKDSINVPRGILETACEYDFEETVPELVEARDKEIVVICRSGNRSVFAAHVMQLMGYTQVSSLKTGLRGWNDYEQPLINAAGKVDIDDAEEYFTPKLRPEQLQPTK